MLVGIACMGKVKENRKVLISKFDTNNIDQNIIEFEKEYKISLPCQYRNFLRKYNA